MNDTATTEIEVPTIATRRQRIPNLTEIELPKLEAVGRTADQTIDRLLGRSRSPIWPWIAVGVVMLAVVGMATAWFTLGRKSSSTKGEDPTDTTATPEPTSSGTPA